ncbi:MAG TPA: hypothetical protein VEC06_00565 [Paucimonas sp.]|nr:hypothetical protein [Paucimonas sp.]
MPVTFFVLRCKQSGSEDIAAHGCCPPRLYPWRKPSSSRQSVNKRFVASTKLEKLKAGPKAGRAAANAVNDASLGVELPGYAVDQQVHHDHACLPDRQGFFDHCPETEERDIQSAANQRFGALGNDLDADAQNLSRRGTGIDVSHRGGLTWY